MTRYFALAFGYLRAPAMLQQRLRHVLIALGVGGLGLLTALCCSLSGDAPPPAAPRPPTLAPERTAAEVAEVERAWEFISNESDESPTEYWWWEAERPQRTNFPEHHPFEPENAEQAAVLSDGKWIGAADAGKQLFLEYQVQVPHSGTYQLHARKFWSHGPFRWRFDEQDWRTCGGEVVLLDAAPLRLHVEANWVELGDVELSAGTHGFRVELLEPNSPAAFDAFVLTRSGFTPRGKLKPDEAHELPPDGWVTFAPPADSFADTPLDLRSLNHARAGDAGFVQVRGDGFVFQKTGEPAKFWGMNAGHEVLQLSPAAMARYARRQAKFGVNLVRLHGAIFREEAFQEFDAGKLERIHALAAALRAEGIYLALSVYFPVWVSIKASDGFAGYDGQQPFSLPYFSKRFQAIQHEWWRKLLEPVNPHTGVSLANDPALAMVEFVNEDSTLFWTFQPYGTIPEAQSAELERQFAAWLIDKYGDLDRAYAHWKSKPANNDNLAAKRVAFLSLWEISTERSARAQDTAEFLTRSMREYYGWTQRFLREELGVRAPTVCSNWMTADPRILGPLDDWANAVCDVMDRHGYHSGHHDGDGAAYSVRAGHEYEDRSALRVDFTPRPEGQEHRGGLSLPFAEPRINGKPSMVSELGWTWPNRYRAEGPLLTAVYGSLHGLDAPVFFVSSETTWVSSLGKFDASEPATMGTFPAAARAFRTGMVRPAEPVVKGALTERALFALNGVPLASVPALDNLRAKDIPLGRTTMDTTRGIDPLAMLVGPVEFSLGANADHLEQQDLAPFVDTKAHTVRSSTGEVFLRYDEGVLEVTTPSLEAVAGFLGAAGPVELPHLKLELENQYATAALVTLDGAPLSESKQLLLQIVTEVQNSGWRTKGKELQVVDDPGGPPLLVRAAYGHFAIEGWDMDDVRIVALDANGTPTRRFVGGSRSVPLLPGPLYYLITR